MNEFFSGLSNQHFVGELSLGVVFFRLFLAVVFGGLVGFERERKRKPAGFRTYILVCFGAAIVSMIQDQLRIHIIDFESTHSGLAAVIKTDLGRLGAQVISGIGFLGAGSIIKERGESIAGMTTAAGIWATGCVGLGIGWGFYNIALVAIVFMLIIMIVLKTVESKIIKNLSLLLLKSLMHKSKTLPNYWRLVQHFCVKNLFPLPKSKRILLITALPFPYPLKRFPTSPNGCSCYPPKRVFSR